jgi:hypothetical protein
MQGVRPSLFEKEVGQGKYAKYFMGAWQSK